MTAERQSRRKMAELLARMAARQARMEADWAAYDRRFGKTHHG